MLQENHMESMLWKDYGVSEEMVQEIGRFTINWNLFEHYYMENEAKNGKIEHGIDLTGIDFKDKMELFREELIDFITVWNNRTIDRESVDEILFHKQEKNPKRISRITDYLQKRNNNDRSGLICIYRFRNNLLHGEKDIWNINHQYKLIKAANNVLEVLTNANSVNIRQRKQLIMNTSQ